MSFYLFLNTDLKDIYDICDASIGSTNNSKYISLDTSKDNRTLRSCRCRVNGNFNLKLIDLRLNDDNQRCSNSNLTVQQTNDGTNPWNETFTCLNSPKFNKVVWRGNQADGFISLSNVYNNFLPAMVWIQLTKKNGRYS